MCMVQYWGVIKTFLFLRLYKFKMGEIWPSAKFKNCNPNALPFACLKISNFVFKKNIKTNIKLFLLTSYNTFREQTKTTEAISIKLIPHNRISKLLSLDNANNVRLKPLAGCPSVHIVDGSYRYIRNHSLNTLAKFLKKLTF